MYLNEKGRLPMEDALFNIETTVRKEALSLM